MNTMRTEAVYGFPCVSDPRDFVPDEESCTLEEMAAWKRDVELAERGEYQRDPSKHCSTEFDVGGQFIRHVTRTPWGIGTNFIRNEADEDCR